MALVDSINEKYINNENWFVPAFNEFHAARGVGEPAPESDTRFTPFALRSHREKSQSILTVWRPVAFTISGTSFDNNFVVDDTDPQVYDPWYNQQSHGLLLIDFAGYFLAKDGTAFENNRGIAGSKFMQHYLDASYDAKGFKNRLLKFHRFKFRRFFIEGIRFIGNEAYNYTLDAGI